MLRCRRCRKGIIDSACLSTVEATVESSAAVCCIWHVNVDTLPEWILTSVQQAQWTVGKLNCQNCSARLGGFNFINRSKCPCGRDATVHLNKSRVDPDHKHYVHIVQPRRTRPEKGHAGLLMGGSQHGEHRPEFNRTALDTFQLNCAAVMSHISPAGASASLADSENTPSFSFSPLYCISHRRRHSLEDDAAIRSSCFCPAGPTNRSAVEMTRAGTDESTWSSVSHPTSQQFDSGDGVASVNAVACHSSVSRRTRSPLDRQLLRAVEDVESSPETTAVHEELSDSAPFLRGRSVSDSVAEQDQEVEPRAFMSSLASDRLSKREKNCLKSLRRKRMRRERWLHNQLEQVDSVSSSLLDSEEEDREGLTCAVCLDVYFSPHSCRPCGHVFCEPCLRTIANNHRPTQTPCPLCRTLISHTSFHNELNQTAKTFFPKVYTARKHNFQSASCAKWPLPSYHKRFRTFWGDQRRAAMAERRWHFVLEGFTLDALDLTDMYGWLFDIGLVIVYIHSVNWILAFLSLGFLIFPHFF